jgi:hypothetical protein
MELMGAGAGWMFPEQLQAIRDAPGRSGSGRERGTLRERNGWLIGSVSCSGSGSAAERFS